MLPSQEAHHGSGTDPQQQQQAPDLWALLPTDLATRILRCAGGPAALGQARATCQSWCSTLDSLTQRASLRSSSSPPGSAVVCVHSLRAARLPRLSAVDLSACGTPLPPGALSRLLADLARARSLTSLTLSTWCLATASEEPQQEPTGSAGSDLLGLQQQQPQPQYCLEVPAALGDLMQLQELFIDGHGPSPPRASRELLTAAVLQLPRLAALELHHFLPTCHHLRGMQLTRLALSARSGPGHAQAGSGLPCDWACCQAAIAALDAGSQLQVLQLRFVPSGEKSQAAFTWMLLEKLCCVAAQQAQQQQQHATTTSQAGTPRAPLQELVLQCAFIFHLPRAEQFAAVGRSLRVLCLGDSYLGSEAADTIGACCGQLQRLSLRNNQLYSLPPSWERLAATLEVLVLSGNPLCSEREEDGLAPPPAVLWQLHQLRELELASVRLTFLPECVTNLTRLQTLDVSRNMLCNPLTAALTQLSCLQQLSVSGNPAPTSVLVPPGLSSRCTVR